ncbi:DUF2863 family protein [soil metagenome]
MRRVRRNDRPGGTRGGSALLKLAVAASTAGSRLEDLFWDQQLREAVLPLLSSSGQATVESALDRLWSSNPRGYDILADVLESTIESTTVEIDGQRFDCLMFIAPLLAWSRGSIASGLLRAADAEALRVQLAAHVLADGARVAVVNRLFTPEQLPASYHDEHELAKALFKSATGSGVHTLRADRVPAPLEFVSDARYVVGAVVVPHGQAVFAWQQDPARLDTARLAWDEQGRGVLASVLAGSPFELMLPGAFYSSLRRVDQASREYHLSAGVAFLGAVLGSEPASLSASVAPFYEDELVEYRIGLTLGRNEEIFHGVTWPILSEADVETAPARIREVLEKAGVTQFFEHEHRFPLEFCDDCGAPLFPNPQGETVHAELPEDRTVTAVSLH